MKKQLQTLLVTSMILTPTLLSIPMPHSVISVKAATDDKEDTKGSETEKKRLEEKTKEWEKDLTAEQKDIVEDLSDKEKRDKINDYLKEKNVALNKEWEEKIETLDKALKDAPKTEKDIIVYTPITSTNDLKEGGTLTEEGYLVGANDNPGGGADFVEVTIPEGESIIYLKNGDILIRRDTEWTISKEPTSISTGGETVTKVEAKLLQKALKFNQDEMEKATTWGNQVFTEWRNNLTPNDEAELNKYSGNWYDDINTYLRTGKLSDDSNRKESAVKERIKAIDEVLKKGTVPQDVIVYRRVTEQQFGKEYNWLRNSDETINEKNATELAQQFKGKTFEQKSFMSTSLTQDPNKSFGNRQSVLLEIKLPKGTHAGFLGEDKKLTNYTDQVELLINKGYTFQYNRFSLVTPTETGAKPYLKIEVTMKKANDK